MDFAFWAVAKDEIVKDMDYPVKDPNELWQKF